MTPRYSQKRFSICRPSAILNLQNFDCFVKYPTWELKSTSAYQIWLKSDTLLRYWDKAIFKMAVVRHLDFAKIARLVMWPISACDSSCPFQISLLFDDTAPRYSQTSFSTWRPSAILNLQNFNFVSKVHPHNWNLHLRTKFDLNRIIHSGDMEIMLFSKWRPSAILNFRKLQFWSSDLYRHVILHFRSKFKTRNKSIVLSRTMHTGRMSVYQEGC